MNAFSVLTQMGMQSSKLKRLQVKVQGYYATVIPENDVLRLVISLKNGGMLNFESAQLNIDELTQFARDFLVNQPTSALN